MADPRVHLLERLRATLADVEQGLRFRPNHEATRYFRGFLVQAIRELENEQVDRAA